MKPDNVIVDKRSEQKIHEILKANVEVATAFDRAVERLKYNCFAGKQVKKEMFPKEIVKEFHPTNLYVFDLIRKHPGWRMLYTITSEGKVKILLVILKVMNHHEYDRLFGYG